MKKTVEMMFAAFLLLFLPKADASVVLNGQEYDITSVAVAYDANWQTQVVADFGSDATVADWIDIKADALAETGGVDLLKGLLNTVGGAASLTYNGQQLEGGIYGYFAAVHNGTVPGGWTVIDDIDNNQVDLGRWTGTRYVVAAIPEPATLGTLGLSVALMLFFRRRFCN
jgi:hypothetical protein